MFIAVKADKLDNEFCYFYFFRDWSSPKKLVWPMLVELLNIITVKKEGCQQCEQGMNLAVDLDGNKFWTVFNFAVIGMSQ